MPAERMKLSVADMDSEEGNARPKSVKRGNVVHPWTSLGGTPKIYGKIPEPCTNHMHPFGQVNAMKRIERSTYSSQHRGTVRGVSGRSAVTDGPYAKLHQSFAQWPQSEEAGTDVSLRKNEKGGIAGCDINDMARNVDMNSTSNINTLTKQEDQTSKATLTSEAVKSSNQAASQ